MQILHAPSALTKFKFNPFAADGHQLPVAEFTAHDAAWKASQDAREALPRFYVEQFGPMRVGPGQYMKRSMPWAVIDRNGDAIIRHCYGEREAREVAAWENEQLELDADPAYAGWLAQLGDALPDYEEADLAEFRR
jgi:hypothetical protein